METNTEPDWNTVGILGAARGARPGTDGAIGTEHLLAGVTTSKGAARAALADEGATKVAVAAVLRARKDGDAAWSGTDDTEGSVAAQAVLGDDGDRGVRLTGAAARALTAAMRQARREGAAKFGAVHLLRALLEEDNRAVELLGACGIAPQAVRARLDGGDGGPGSAGGGGSAGAGDDLHPLLRPTRDVLLGRARYRRMPFWQRWVVKYGAVNWAVMPAGWVRWETYEQARRLGDRAVGTEHVLLAVLATHEVVLRYPHLMEDGAPAPGTRYAGGARLAALGLDHASVHGVLAGDRVELRPDPRPAERYLDEAAGRDAGGQSGPDGGPSGGPAAEPGGDPGTGPLVDILLREETRARQLIDALISAAGD
ncbi:Clp protease N-terminal domain-containing protein [Streptomyces albus]|uniref:Clp protease N-terminal domain-containing protein n=1 Tax=Streptomyces albus TaxID=1888 RepID=UPI0004CC781E|nr:Clp protease N-terminal domain-containing protein [Streptomyces albus]